MILAEETLFLGEDLLPFLVLAFGAALVAGNVAALLRPPAAVREEAAQAAERAKSKKGESAAAAVERPPLGRSLGMIALGLIAAIWAVASLLA